MKQMLSMCHHVKRTYFPGWDDTNEWHVQLKARLSDGFLGDAYCNRKKKTIEISRTFNANNDDEWCCLLAHLLSHAISGAEHNHEWIVRLLAIARQAEISGRQALADLIRDDIAISQDAKHANLIPILQNIESAVADQPNASFETIVEFAAGAWVKDVNELVKQYGAVRKYYDVLKA